uniref:Integrase_H2C2 domain-containing protein n=1 Tax=Syphacia muris TaxID=451379 RepID=A0A0N5AAI3_9BILA
MHRKDKVWSKGREDNEIPSFELKREAEIMFIKEAQKSIAQEEIDGWELFKDKKLIWKLSGRCALQSECDKAVYLPKEYPVVTQLILEAHKNCGHFGAPYTLTEFRKRF